METLSDLVNPLDEIKIVASSIEENDNSDYVYTILKNMIKRLDTDIEKSNMLGDSIQDLKMFLNIQQSDIKKSRELSKLVRESLTRFIASHGIQLIEEYSNICGDSKFDNYTIPEWKKADELVQPVLPPMSAEDMLNIDTYVENNSRWNLIRKANERGATVTKKPKEINRYIVGQIVGVKDSERKWWMARILYIFNDPSYPYPWYYIHFEGWGDIQNEWVSSPLRIKKFNPRRDFLRR